MDWYQDNAVCDAAEPRNHFTFGDAGSKLVRVTPNTQNLETRNMNSDKDWDDWFGTEHPKLDGSASGLILILATRVEGRKKRGITEAKIAHPVPCLVKKQPTVTTKSISPASTLSGKTLVSDLSSEAEKAPLEMPNNPVPSQTGGQRVLRDLPFSKDLFQKIAERFYIHRSIARTINRADIPTFSATELEMGDGEKNRYPAIVYNCRTSNSWGGDLALSATYFPHCGLTFAVMFGCSESVKEQILGRLEAAVSETGHPLLTTGIFVELERKRHVHTVELTIDELEVQILELNSHSEDAELLSAEEQVKKQELKRKAWLDTMYVRGQMINWITHLEKIARHADELNRTRFRECKHRRSTLQSSAEAFESRGGPLGDALVLPSRHGSPNLPVDHIPFQPSSSSTGMEDGGLERAHSDDENLKARLIQEEERECLAIRGDIQGTRDNLRRTGSKVKDRIEDIIHEYHEKTRECTSRVDGMTMATQWALGETSVEIALAASRDSRHMRSIALVTMIFLPGTFFASIFSMGFFDWSDSGNGGIVSGYFWIYVVLAIAFTFVTIACWWYLGVYRYSRRRRSVQSSKFPFCERSRILTLCV